MRRRGRIFAVFFRGTRIDVVDRGIGVSWCVIAIAPVRQKKICKEEASAEIWLLNEAGLPKSESTGLLQLLKQASRAVWLPVRATGGASYDAARPAQRHDLSKPVGPGGAQTARSQRCSLVVLVGAKEPSVERGGFARSLRERVRCPPHLRRLTAVPPAAPRAVRRSARRHGRCWDHCLVAARRWSAMRVSVRLEVCFSSRVGIAKWRWLRWWRRDGGGGGGDIGDAATGVWRAMDEDS